MKTVKKYASLVLWVSLVTLASCHNDDTKPKGEFATGVLIVNEGNFHSSDGSLTFYNPANGSVQQDIFGLKNNGKALGDVVQSADVDGDVAYMVVNNDNKLEIANANTMESLKTLTGFSLPRYFTTLNGKGYVTEWVSFSDPGRVSVVNLQSRTIEATIPTNDYGSENIIGVNNKLYVSNNFSYTVSVIDPAQNKVVDTIAVSSSPGGFAVDKDGKLWVICGGGFDSNFAPLNDGALVRINTATNEVEKTVSLGKNVTAKVAINGAKDKLYYFDGNSIYQVNLSDASGPASALITEAAVIGFYGIGIDPATEILYAADAKGFSGNGTVYRYNSAGASVDNFTSGRGPNGFVFR